MYVGGLKERQKMEGVGWGDPNKLGEDEVCVWW